MIRPPTEDQLRKIRTLASEVIGPHGYAALINEIGAPETGAEANTILGALHKIKNGMTFLHGAEMTVGQLLEDMQKATYTPDPEERPHIPDPTSESNAEKVATSVARNRPAIEPVGRITRTRICVACHVEKPIGRFHRKGQGHRKTCIECLTPSGDGDTATVARSSATVEPSPEPASDPTPSNSPAPDSARGEVGSDLLPARRSEPPNSPPGLVVTYVEGDLNILEIPLGAAGNITVTMRINLYELTGPARRIVLDFIDAINAVR